MNELEDKKLSELYRSSAKESPSAESDAAILAAARRAVQAGPVRKPGLLQRRWLPPLLAAATVAVIAVGIVRMLPPEEIAQPGMEGAEPKPETPTQPLAKEEAPPPAPAPAQAAKPTPPPARPQAKAAPVQRTQRAPEPRDTPGFVPSPPAAASRAESGAPAQPASPPAAAALPPPAAAAPTETRERAFAAPESGAARKDAAAGAAPPAFTPPAASAPAMSGEASAPSRKELKAKSAFADRAGPEAQSARDPETWLKDIRKLREAGRMEEAARELAAFRRRYPDYELPRDLRDQ